MIALRERACAKINLTLRITGKRADGYHLLDSLVAFADIADELEAKAADELTIAFHGPYAGKLSVSDNSVMAAANALIAYAGNHKGATITLHKNLPVASGIGGGSADAAAALRLLSRLWHINIPSGDMKSIALKLGADVPACLTSSCLYMNGIGEQMEAGPQLPGLHIALVNPGVALKTQAVFAAFGGVFSAPEPHPKKFAGAQDCIDFLRQGSNDLEAAAISIVPQIKTVLDAIAKNKACGLARMSGSGATCFGLFTDADAAREAVTELQRNNPSWWVREATLT